MGNKKSTASVQTSAQTNAKHVSNFSNDATTNRRMNMQKMQNALPIWLDNDINENSADYSDTIKQLKGVINNVNMFTDGNQCVEFIQASTNNKICMVISGSLGQCIVPCVHDMSQVDTIFIFCNNQEWHKQWTEEWPKIKGVFTDITPICEALKQAVHQCERNAISISIVTPTEKLDQLDPTFMYTQILKEILLTIKFEDKNFEEFINYCREAFDGDKNKLNDVTKFQTTYKNNIPIWWYTWDAFLYPMLNQSLRLMDVDIIVRMGFFLKDLHCNIHRMHSKQFRGQRSGEKFTVYRGQCLPKQEFIKMTKTKNGLLSFNNFLSTSKDRNLSLFYAPQVATSPDIVGILYVISITPADSTTPFASIADVSCFHEENEVLFSMHTIFRIGDIKPIDEKNHLYEVNLTLTRDNDEDLRTLTDRIQQETFPHSRGWYRLGQLLQKMGQFNKAQQLYDILLTQATNESDKASIYHHLGSIKNNQGEYQKALTYYEKSLAIKQKILPSNDPSLATFCNNVSLLYMNMGDYPKSVLLLEKAFIIQQQSLPSNHPDLSAAYNNIGSVYEKMGDFSKALSYYENDLAIKQQSLPTNHPDLATYYSNIGSACKNMGNYPKALSYYEKALTIEQQSLPSNHPDLGISYSNISYMHYRMDDYSKALSTCEKAILIQQQSLPSNHPDLGVSYSNIANMYASMGDYPKAFLYYDKAFGIQQQSLPFNHPDLGVFYSNIGMMYQNMDDYPQALSYYQKALVIQQQSLPSNHPALARSYNNIGSVLYTVDDYTKALSCHEKAFAIRQQSLHSNHPDLAQSYNKIGLVDEKMGNYSKAHLFFECAVQIGQQLLPTDHRSLQRWRKDLENIKKKL
ncbi:unnamed protein product [Adineta steineri]|uniref:Uncharacterized protein n=1 Tax=Adineta steineri TaxID=433720 RepID=A0A819SW47_9BILA|nr:unnamed protein product [Adineta steineri]CAF4069446.1 unnamed protein product [Adineta steineri]